LGSFGGAVHVYEDFIKEKATKPDSEMYQLIGEAALRYPEPQDSGIADLLRKGLKKVGNEAKVNTGSIPGSLEKACHQRGAILNVH